MKGCPTRSVLLSNSGCPAPSFAVDDSEVYISIIGSRLWCNKLLLSTLCARRCGLMVSALVSGSLSPGRGHCLVFLGKTLNSHSAYLHPSSETQGLLAGTMQLIFLGESLPQELKSPWELILTEPVPEVVVVIGQHFKPDYCLGKSR